MNQNLKENLIIETEFLLWRHEYSWFKNSPYHSFRRSWCGETSSISIIFIPIFWASNFVFIQQFQLKKISQLYSAILYCLQWKERKMNPVLQDLQVDELPLKFSLISTVGSNTKLIPSLVYWYETIGINIIDILEVLPNHHVLFLCQLYQCLQNS